jgi:hypothetical protein
LVFAQAAGSPPSWRHFQAVKCRQDGGDPAGIQRIDLPGMFLPPIGKVSIYRARAAGLIMLRELEENNYPR